MHMLYKMEPTQIHLDRFCSLESINCNKLIRSLGKEVTQSDSRIIGYNEIDLGKNGLNSYV